MKLIFRNLDKKLFYSGSVYTVYSLLNNGLSFVLLIALAEMYKTDGYGYLSLIGTSSSLLAIFLPLSTIGYISVSYFKKTRESFYEVVKSVTYLSFLTFLILLLVTTFWGDKIVVYVGLPVSLQFLTLSITLMSIIINIGCECCRVQEKIKLYGIISLSKSLSLFLFTILFVVFWADGWIGKIKAEVIVLAFTSIGVLFYLIKSGYFSSLKISKNNLVETLRFGVPLLPHSFSFWLRQGLDRYVINYFYSLSIVGAFSFAYNIANVIYIFGASFNSAYSVFIYKKLRKLEDTKDRTIIYEIKGQLQVMSLVYIILLLIVLVAAYVFIPILFPTFKNSLPYIVPLCLSTFIQCYYLLFVNFLLYHRKTRALMQITVTMSVLNAIFSYLFTRYSVMYTAYISMICSLGILMFVLCNAYIIFKKKKNDC